MEVSGQLHVPAALSTGEEPYWMGDGFGLRVDVDILKEGIFLGGAVTGFEPWHH